MKSIIERKLVELKAGVPYQVEADTHFDLTWTEFTLRSANNTKVDKLKIIFENSEGNKIEDYIFLDVSGLTVTTVDAKTARFSPVYSSIEFLSTNDFTFELWVKEVENSLGFGL